MIGTEVDIVHSGVGRIGTAEIILFWKQILYFVFSFCILFWRFFFTFVTLTPE